MHLPHRKRTSRQMSVNRRLRRRALLSRLHLIAVNQDSRLPCCNYINNTSAIFLRLDIPRLSRIRVGRPRNAECENVAIAQYLQGGGGGRGGGCGVCTRACTCCGHRQPPLHRLLLRSSCEYAQPQFTMFIWLGPTPDFRSTRLQAYIRTYTTRYV
jgi:hypothetical protein